MDENTLELLSQCVQASFRNGIPLSGCGMNIACFSTLYLAGQLYVAADPSLSDSRQPVIIASIAILMVISGLALFGRLISRKISGISFWMDDYLIILALVGTYTLNIVMLFGVHFGYGKHVITLTLSDITNFAKMYWASQLVFGCAITFTKFLILFMYLRIFPSQGFRNVCIGIMIFYIAWWISLTLSIIFGCTPVNYYWNKSIGGHCININALAYGITAANFITDLSIWFLPIPWLWKLRMKMPRKLAVIGIFFLGCLFSHCSGYSANLTAGSVINPGIWISIECNLGIVCACLPIMRPLSKKFQSFASFSSWVAKYSLDLGSYKTPSQNYSNTGKSESKSSGSGKSYKDGEVFGYGDINAKASPYGYKNGHEMIEELKRNSASEAEY